MKAPARWRKAHLDLGAALLSRDRSAAIQQSGSRRRTATLPYSARRLRRCLKPAAAPSDSTPCLFAKQSQCRQEARDCSAASRRSTTHRNRSAALGTVPAGSADKAVVLQNKAITTLRIDHRAGPPFGAGRFSDVSATDLRGFRKWLNSAVAADVNEKILISQAAGNFGKENAGIALS